MCRLPHRKVTGFLVQPVLWNPVPDHPPWGSRAAPGGRGAGGRLSRCLDFFYASVCLPAPARVCVQSSVHVRMDSCIFIFHIVKSLSRSALGTELMFPSDRDGLQGAGLAFCLNTSKDRRHVWKTKTEDGSEDTGCRALQGQDPCGGYLQADSQKCPSRCRGAPATAQGGARGAGRRPGRAGGAGRRSCWDVGGRGLDGETQRDGRALVARAREETRQAQDGMTPK